jgi:hypothetical protein
MDQRTNSASRCRVRIAARHISLTACLLFSANGYTPALDSSQSQASTPPPAPAASTRPETKKAPETTAPTPAPVTDPHQAQILADTQKLLKLSQELKAEVAKTNKDTLSVTVIKKAEEVEKLAKTLKEEMSKSH